MQPRTHTYTHGNRHKLDQFKIAMLQAVSFTLFNSLNCLACAVKSLIMVCTCCSNRAYDQSPPNGDTPAGFHALPKTAGGVEWPLFEMKPSIPKRFLRTAQRQPAVPSLQPAAPSLQLVTSQVYGVTSQVYGVTSQVYGVTSQVYGVTSQVYGVTSQVYI
ncbi:hypothetical protein RRG08_056618 [Elysia crispata]|uniref:Uncharacterized protein n=1 Tax=Elysia crispata TaxID=231223 RepID=A0AAE1E8D1_9GAST|nr:hypothetical protein RRG08_056618 [Elysia crispata]